MRSHTCARTYTHTHTSHLNHHVDSSIYLHSDWKIGSLYLDGLSEVAAYWNHMGELWKAPETAQINASKHLARKLGLGLSKASWGIPSVASLRDTILKALWGQCHLSLLLWNADGILSEETPADHLLSRKAFPDVANSVL